MKVDVPSGRTICMCKKCAPLVLDYFTKKIKEAVRRLCDK